MKPTMVVVHSSATPDGSKLDYGASDIDAWHRARGFANGIGYHRVVKRSGVIEVGRPLNMQGAHTKGHNTKSIGVCYIGTKSPTPSQVKSLVTLYCEFKIHWSQWFGHYEFDKVGKICPGFSMPAFRYLLANVHEGVSDETTLIQNFLLVAALEHGRK